MATDKYLTMSSGVPTEITAASAGGAGDANKLPKLDSNGQLTLAMMPSGLGTDSVTVTAPEALAAGDFVNVYDNSGAFAVRKADATSSAKFANGYVLAAVTNGGSATVYTDDLNNQVTSQVAGSVFLSASTPGKTQATAPTGSGQISQRLGFAASATIIKVKIDQHYVLA